MFDQLFQFEKNHFVQIHCGDCVEILRRMPEGRFHTCVTSPPYYGLRDYGIGGQIGLEETPGKFVSRLVDVFREVRRVLRDDATLWLNIGDSYAAQRGGTHQPAETLAGGKGGRTKDGARVNRDRYDGYNPTRNASAIGLKHKDLIGIPWLLAFALREDGWYLRQDIIWHKPNPMPESVGDRCTKSHEYIFMLSKSPRYYFDAAAIGDPIAGNRSVLDDIPDETIDVSDKRRNRHSVWSVNTRPYRGAHFATFPPDLIRPCILAGSPEGGYVLDPFGGSGTTGVVARSLGRYAELIELNPDYVDLAEKRLSLGAGK